MNPSAPVEPTCDDAYPQCENLPNYVASGTAAGSVVGSWGGLIACVALACSPTTTLSSTWVVLIGACGGVPSAPLSCLAILSVYGVSKHSHYVLNNVNYSNKVKNHNLRNERLKAIAQEYQEDKKSNLYYQHPSSVIRIAP